MQFIGNAQTVVLKMEAMKSLNEEDSGQQKVQKNTILS